MRAGSLQVRLLGILAIGISCSIIACSGGGAAPAAPAAATPVVVQPVIAQGTGSTSDGTGTLALAPTAATVATNGSLNFTATIGGTGTSSVTWAVDTIPGGNSLVGTAGGSGLTVTYQAPSTVGSHLLTATSTSDATLIAYATITVQDSCPPVPAGPTTVSVKDAAYGAKGDGVSDDTAAIQKAINAVAGTGGTLLVPNGTYMINAITSGNMGLQLKSQMTLKMAAGASLQAITNSAGNYTIITIASAYNVNVIGGTLVGERSTHTGTSGEWGMGLSISGSQQVVINGVTVKECWGDGFYIYNNSSDVTLCAVVADHNRRNGLSIISTDGLVVRNSTFKNTRGHLPEDGIDIEPNPGDKVNNVLISGCIFDNNAGNGCEDGVPDGNTGTAFITNCEIDGNTSTNNGVGAADTEIKDGIRLSNAPNHKITNNIVLGNTGHGIYIRNNANYSIISNNIVMTTTGDGIYYDWNTGLVITNNTIQHNTGYGLKANNGFSCTVTGNVVSGNGKTP